MLFESLETRSLMSGSAIAMQVSSDQMSVHNALSKFRQDAVSDTAMLKTDREALIADGLSKDAVLAPLFAKLENKATALRHTVSVDNLENSSAVVKAQALVTKAVKQYALDDDNQAERQADRGQIRQDRGQLEEAQITDINNRLQARQAQVNSVTDQLNAITAALATDTGASSPLAAAVTRFVADAKSFGQTLIADLQSVAADRTLLGTAMTASLSVTI